MHGGQKEKETTKTTRLTLTNLMKDATYFLHVVTCNEGAPGEAAYSDPIKFKVTIET